MSTNDAVEMSYEVFLRVAAGAGLDVSDAERMEDMHRRVTMMRSGLARVFEVDVRNAESPSAFIAETRQ